MDFGSLSQLNSVFTVAVMPTVAIGGPLALLALLFPATFGGMILFARRWRSVLTVLSLNSTIFILHRWFYAYLFDSWWLSQFELWFVMTTVAVAALILQRPPASDASSTGKTGDLVFLGFISTVSMTTYACGRYYPLSWISDYTGLSFLLMVAATTGLCYALSKRIATNNEVSSLEKTAQISDSIPPLPQEVDSQTSALDAEISNKSSNGPNMNPAPKFSLQAIYRGTPAFFLLVLVLCGIYCTVGAGIRMTQADSFRLKWMFTPGKVGAIYASPLVVDEMVYAAVALQSPPAGELYCLNRETGKLLWSFNNDGKMKPGISSPIHADGKIFIGEGFHEDTGCKVYCISAKAGKKIWEFETIGHTESTPNVVDGRVYFGAGDDGLYCLDASTGNEIWHFIGPHVDGCPAVEGNYVYAGSGYGTREVFCVEANSGNPIWRVPIKGASFGSATVSNGKVLFGIGSWNPQENQKPFGALLCLDARTGHEIWRIDVGAEVHTQPVCFDGQTYFVCGRDVLCINTASGLLRWKRSFPESIFSSPFVSASNQSGAGALIWLATEYGSIMSLDPHSGTECELFYPSLDETIRIIRARPTIIINPGRNRQIYVAGTSRAPRLFAFE